MNKIRLAKQVARYYMRKVLKVAGPLSDPSHLRYQAVFLMGPPGSGKSFVTEGKYLKYMPGAPSEGLQREDLEEGFSQDLSESDRNLNKLKFDRAVENLQSRGFSIELADSQTARIPFKLYYYDETGSEVFIPREDYNTTLPNDIYKEVEDIQEVLFRTPEHAAPSYWRQISPDNYKEELPGYRPESSGYIHEMSAVMGKAYFQAVIDSGDPMVVDGTGTNLRKMIRQIKEAKEAGYRTTIVYVYVPLTLSLMRNATRKRKVNPYVILNQWKIIKSNFPKLRDLADKAKFIDNSNPSFDKRMWKHHGDKIDQFMIRFTNDTLAEFIMEEAPSEKRVLRNLGII